MRAFLINMDRSGDRLAHMRREFERVGIEFDRVPAVDGALLDADVLSDFHCHRVGVYPGRWLPGEIGCFLSHFAIWQRIASDENAFAAVFEDDVHLAKDTKALMGTADWIPDDCDIVRLEANRKMTLVNGRNISVAPRRRVYRAASATWGSGGYVISRRAANKLIAVDPEFHCWLDVFLFHPGRSPIAAGLKTYQVTPAVCIQDQLTESARAELHSSIGADGRTPIVEDSTIGRRLKAFLPWKKRRIEFQP